MKKTLILLITVILLVAVNLYAADGDLIVTGSAKVGVDAAPTPGVALDVVVDEMPGIPVKAANFHIDINGSTNPVGTTTALRSLIEHTGSSSWTQARGGDLEFWFNSLEAGSSAFTHIYGLNVVVRDRYENNRNYSGDSIVLLRTNGAYTGNGTVSVEDMIGAMIENPSTYTEDEIEPLSATNLYGIKVEKQTVGVNNYGIVLNGDGEGADIVMGAGQDVKLYGQNGDFIIDSNGNVIIQNLPTSDPVVSGALWNNNGTLKISSGS